MGTQPVRQIMENVRVGRFKVKAFAIRALHKTGVLRLANKAHALGEKLYGGECMSFRQITGLIWPLFVDQLFLQGINILNTAMISSYGPEAISAVGIIGSFNFFIISVFMSIATGCAVVVAQYYGRRERGLAARAAAQAVTLTLLITVVIGAVLLIFTDAAIDMLLGRAEPLTKEYARIFLIGNVVSYPLVGLLQTMMSALRGAGNAKATMLFSTGINSLNLALNIVFLYIARLGVRGLSMSVILCRVVFAALAVIYMAHPKNSLRAPIKDYLKIDAPLQRSILFIAVPTGLEQVFFHGGRIVTQVFIVWFGTMSTTANAIGTTFNGILMVSGQAISMALMTIVGQCIGMGNIGEAKRYIRRATFTSVVTCALSSLILLPLMHPLLRFYNLPPEAYRLAYGAGLMLLIGTPLTWCVSFVTPSGLRAGGDATFSTVTSLICMWGVRVGLGYVLGVSLGFGLYGVWFAMFTEWAVRGVVFQLRAAGRKWYSHKVIHD